MLFIEGKINVGNSGAEFLIHKILTFENWYNHLRVEYKVVFCLFVERGLVAPVFP